MNIANNMSELAKMAMVTPGLTLRVDSASQSAQIQQIMIANGATWWKHGTEILDTTLPYIGCVGIDRVELVEPGDDRIFMYTQGEQASEWGKLDLTAQAVLHNSDTIMLKTELDALQSMDSKVTTPMQVLVSLTTAAIADDAYYPIRLEVESKTDVQVGTHGELIVVGKEYTKVWAPGSWATYTIKSLKA